MVYLTAKSMVVGPTRMRTDKSSTAGFPEMPGGGMIKRVAEKVTGNRVTEKVTGNRTAITVNRAIATDNKVAGEATIMRMENTSREVIEKVTLQRALGANIAIGAIEESTIRRTGGNISREVIEETTSRRTAGEVLSKWLIEEGMPRGQTEVDIWPKNAGSTRHGLCLEK